MSSSTSQQQGHQPMSVSSILDNNKSAPDDVMAGFEPRAPSPAPITQLSSLSSSSGTSYTIPFPPLSAVPLPTAMPFSLPPISFLRSLHNTQPPSTATTSTASQPSSSATTTAAATINESTSSYAQQKHTPPPKRRRQASPAPTSTTPPTCTTQNCLVCARGAPPCFAQSPSPTWADICYTALYALTMANPDQKFFHIKKDICNFIDAHYDTLCMRDRTSIWRQTVNMTLSHPQYYDLFQQESSLENGRKGFYGLKLIADPFDMTEITKRTRSRRRKEGLAASSEDQLLVHSSDSMSSSQDSTTGPAMASSAPATPTTTMTDPSPLTHTPINTAMEMFNQQGQRIVSSDDRVIIKDSVRRPSSGDSGLKELEEAALQCLTHLGDKPLAFPEAPASTTPPSKRFCFRSVAGSSNSSTDDDLPDARDGQLEIDEDIVEAPPVREWKIEPVMCFPNFQQAPPRPATPTSPFKNSQWMQWQDQPRGDALLETTMLTTMPCKRARKTTRPEEKAMLETYYQEHSGRTRHTRVELDALASQLKWKVSRIQRWLDNRRTKEKMISSRRGIATPPLTSSSSMPPAHLRNKVEPAFVSKGTSEDEEDVIMEDYARPLALTAAP